MLANEEKLKSALAKIWKVFRKRIADNNDMNASLVFNDANRRLNKDDFKIYYCFTLKKDPMLFIEFPNPIGKPHNEAKCLGIWFSRHDASIRMFTMEYYDEEPDWTFKGHYVLGEWMHKNRKIVAHRNMGLLDGSDIISFVETLGEILASKNPNKIIEDRTLLISRMTP